MQYTAPPIREWLEESANAFAQLPFIAAVCHALQGSDLQTAWERAILVSFPQLSAADTAPLRALGVQLGKSEAHTQQRCVQEAVAALEERRLQALSDAQKADKLYLTLGLSGGLAMALLWI